MFDGCRLGWVHFVQVSWVQMYMRCIGKRDVSRSHRLDTLRVKHDFQELRSMRESVFGGLLEWQHYLCRE